MAERHLKGQSRRGDGALRAARDAIGAPCDPTTAASSFEAQVTLPKGIETPRGARSRLGRAMESAGSGAYLVVEADDLGFLRRTCGFDRAEDVVEDALERLADTAPRGAVWARVGEGRLSFVLRGASVDEARAVAETLAALAADSVECEGGAYPFCASVGGAMFSAGEVTGPSTAENVAMRAEVALGEARKRGCGGVQIFSRGYESARLAGDAGRIRDKLRAALIEGRITLAAQDIIVPGQTARVAFRECLVRMIDVDGAVVPAGEFMPAIVGDPLEVEIDRRVLALALGHLVRNPVGRLSVNVSVNTLADEPWHEILETAASANPSAVERLIVEVTESTAMSDPKAVARAFARIRTQRAALALDDFGAGATSFRHLRDFRFDIVKIDGECSRGAADDRDKRVFIRALLDIAAHFEMFSVAEFIDDARDARALAWLGVDAMQGYLYSRPELLDPPASSSGDTAVA